MGLKVHMIDEKFGMLTVLEELKEKDKNGKIWYKCRCECGNIINVIGYYKSIELFGGVKEYELTKIRDSVKNKYCEDSNIKLLRVPYWEFKNMRKIIIDFITNND